MPKTLKAAHGDTALAEPEQPRRKSLKSWFPIRSDMVQREEFRTLSPCEAVVLLDVNYRLQEHLSLTERGWRKGPFAESDEKWAKRLRMSPETFRRARYKVGKAVSKISKTQGFGWFTYTPGYRRQDGSAERTKYHGAEYAKVQKGIQCGALSRDTWRALIEFLKKGQLDHSCLVAVALLAYFWKIQGGREMESIVIPKAKVKATGMTSQAFKRALTEAAKALPKLFAFKETHRAFEIAHWEGGPDASQETNPLFKAVNG